MTFPPEARCISDLAFRWTMGPNRLWLDKKTKSSPGCWACDHNCPCIACGRPNGIPPPCLILETAGRSDEGGCVIASQRGPDLTERQGRREPATPLRMAGKLAAARGIQTGLRYGLDVAPAGEPVGQRRSPARWSANSEIANLPPCRPRREIRSSKTVEQFGHSDKAFQSRSWPSSIMWAA